MVDAKDIIFQQYDGNKILEINDGNYVGIGGNAAGAGEIRIYEDTDNGTHYTGFKAGNNTESIAYTLPTADAASSGQALVSNASGVLSWATVSANTPTSADGQALGSASLEWSDLFLADGGTIQFGNDQDVTLTHVADTGLLLNSTMQLQFNDASQYINAPSATVLDINATDEIELNATAVDLNATLDVSGTSQFNSTVTVGVNDTGYDVKFFGATSGKSFLWDESADTLIVTGTTNLVGTTNLDAVDIDGAVQLDSTLTVGANDQGYDIIIYGDTASANMTWDTSVDDLIFNGAARIVIPDGQLVLGSTAVTSTAAELNLLDGVSGLVQADLTKLAAVDSTAAEINIVDGDTSATSTTVADADRVVMNDNGTMVQVAVTDLAAYFDDEITAMPNLTSVGTLTALTVDDITINGSTISDSGAFDIDVGGNITLDADGGTITFADAGSSLGTITSSGYSGTAAVATTVTITDNESTNENNAIVFTAGGDLDGGNLGLESDGDLFYNPSTGTISATALDISGNVDIDGTLETDALSIASTTVTSTAAELNKLDGVGTLAQAGKHSLWIPAAAMSPTVSNGCSNLTVVETTSGRPDMVVLDFDKDSDEFAQFSVAFPKSWNAGTITFQLFWSGLAATTGIAMSLQGVSFADNDSIDTAYGTAVVVQDDAQGAVEELLVSAESGAVTIAGSPGDNELCYFRIGRDVSDSNDDMAGDCRLHGVKLFYTTDAANDA